MGGRYRPRDQKQFVQSSGCEFGTNRWNTQKINRLPIRLSYQTTNHLSYLREPVCFPSQCECQHFGRTCKGVSSVRDLAVDEKLLG